MSNDPEIHKLSKRVSDLELRDSERWEVVKRTLDRLVVAISGDPDNDILGVIGRMKVQDATIADQGKQIEALKAEWSAARNQVTGATKAWRILWAFIGAGGFIVLYKIASLILISR